MLPPPQQQRQRGGQQQHHDWIEVREEVEESAARNDETLVDWSDNVAASSTTTSSSCSLVDQMVELSTLADFVTCRDVQAPLQVIPPPNLSPNQFIPLPDPAFQKDVWLELETLGEFLGFRTAVASSLSTTAPNQPTFSTSEAAVALRLHSTARTATSTILAPIITNEINPLLITASTSPRDHLPDPPTSARDSHRIQHGSSRHAAVVTTPLLSNSRTNRNHGGTSNSRLPEDTVYMCPVAPSTPHYYNDSYGALPPRRADSPNRERLYPEQQPHESQVQQQLYSHEVSSLNVLPEEHEPLLAIVDEEESGRTSMRAVRDEDSSSISCYQAPAPREARSPVRVRYATLPPKHQHHHHHTGRNRVVIQAPSRDVDDSMPSRPRQQHHAQPPQSSRQPPPPPHSSNHHRRPQQQPPASHAPRRPSHQHDVSIATTTTSCSTSHHPYHQYYAPVPDSDTVRAVAPRKVGAGGVTAASSAGLHSMASSSAVSSTQQNKVMIVVVRRPQHHSSRDDPERNYRHRHATTMDSMLD
jgi:hypothetical protein